MRIISIIYLLCVGVCTNHIYCLNVTNEDFGTLIGSTTKSAWTQQIIFQFLGVRYAKSPSGSRRFKKPVLAIPWPGHHDVQNYGRPCPCFRDIHMKAIDLNGDIEDCLHMSIFTKNITANDAVMVYIHGGAFERGSSREHPPNYLLEKNIVLVVPQYRLGPMGFLSTNSEEIPGNAAIHDIILALQWIQTYVHNFGGNPNKITLFGQSAGAALISAMLMSPSVPTNLFHKAILQSGSALATWVYDFQPEKNAKDIAAFCGCNRTDTIKHVNKCFMNLNPIELLEGYQKHVAVESPKGIDQFGGSKLIINDLISFSPQFLRMSCSTAKNVSLMAGVTKNDGTFILAMIYEYLISTIGIKNKSFNTYSLLPTILDFLGVRDFTNTLTGFLTNKLYSQNTIANGDFSEMTPGLVDIVSVITMKAPILSVVQEYSKVNPNKAFLYSFDYEGEYSPFKMHFNSSNYPFFNGVHHSDENIYLFPYPKYVTNLNTNDLKISKTMIELWTTFATNEEPSSENIPNWPTVTGVSGPFLHINTKSTIGEDFLDEYSVETSKSNSSPNRSSSIEKNYNGIFVYAIIVIFDLYLRK